MNGFVIKWGSKVNFCRYCLFFFFIIRYRVLGVIRGRSLYCDVSLSGKGEGRIVELEGIWVII